MVRNDRTQSEIQWFKQQIIRCGYLHLRNSEGAVQRDSGLASMKSDPLLRNVERDPRYAAFMKKVKLPLD